MLSLFGKFMAMSILLMSSANAHIGHIGELAGHGHVIGVAGLVAAAAMAALLAQRGKSKSDDKIAEADSASADESEQDADNHDLGERANG